jgi:hypothetical protein
MVIKILEICLIWIHMLKQCFRFPDLEIIDSFPFFLFWSKTIILNFRIFLMSKSKYFLSSLFHFGRLETNWNLDSKIYSCISQKFIQKIFIIGFQIKLDSNSLDGHCSLRVAIKFVRSSTMSTSESFLRLSWSINKLDSLQIFLVRFFRPSVNKSWDQFVFPDGPGEMLSKIYWWEMDYFLKMHMSLSKMKKRGSFILKKN